MLLQVSSGSEGELGSDKNRVSKDQARLGECPSVGAIPVYHVNSRVQSVGPSHPGLMVEEQALPEKVTESKCGGK